VSAPSAPSHRHHRRQGHRNRQDSRGPPPAPGDEREALRENPARPAHNAVAAHVGPIGARTGDGGDVAVVEVDGLVQATAEGGGVPGQSWPEIFPCSICEILPLVTPMWSVICC